MPSYDSDQCNETNLSKLNELPNDRSSFSQTHRIGNNGKISIRGLTTWKQKNQEQNVTQVSIEPGTLTIQV